MYINSNIFDSCRKWMGDIVRIGIGRSGGFPVSFSFTSAYIWLINKPCIDDRIYTWDITYKMGVYTFCSSDIYGRTKFCYWSHCYWPLEMIIFWLLSIGPSSIDWGIRSALYSICPGRCSKWRNYARTAWSPIPRHWPVPILLRCRWQPVLYYTDPPLGAGWERYIPNNLDMPGSVHIRPHHMPLRAVNHYFVQCSPRALIKTAIYPTEPRRQHK